MLPSIKEMQFCLSVLNIFIRGMHLYLAFPRTDVFKCHEEHISSTIYLQFEIFIFSPVQPHCLLVCETHIIFKVLERFLFTSITSCKLSPLSSVVHVARVQREAFGTNLWNALEEISCDISNKLLTEFWDNFFFFFFF